MQAFLLPKLILRDLDNVNKEFYWKKGEKHHPLINWYEICKSQEKGGAGIRKAEDVNITFQLKLLWKIMVESENIWVKFIKEKYLRETMLLDYNKKGSTS